MQRIEETRIKVGQVVVTEELILDNDGVVWERVGARKGIYEIAFAYFWGEL